MGLPGSGKTSFASLLNEKLQTKFSTEWLNADEVRTKTNDWDFSIDGRIRQSLRMKDMIVKSEAEYIIIDMVAPLVEMRKNISPDITIWINTILKSRFEDTDSIFIPPKNADIVIHDFNYNIDKIVKQLLND